MYTIMLYYNFNSSLIEVREQHEKVPHKTVCENSFHFILFKLQKNDAIGYHNAAWVHGDGEWIEVLNWAIMVQYDTIMVSFDVRMVNHTTGSPCSFLGDL